MDNILYYVPYNHECNICIGKNKKYNIIDKSDDINSHFNTSASHKSVW